MLPLKSHQWAATHGEYPTKYKKISLHVPHSLYMYLRIGCEVVDGPVAEEKMKVEIGLRKGSSPHRSLLRTDSRSIGKDSPQVF